MDRRGGYAKRRGILPRPSSARRSSPVTIQRRETVGNEERESEDFSPPSPSIDQPKRTKTPVILTKPRLKKNDEEEEEWPAIGRRDVVVSNRSVSSSRRIEDENATEESTTDQAEQGTSNFRGLRRSTPVSSTIAASPGPAAHSYHIQQKAANQPSDSGPREATGSSAKTLRGGIRLITEGMEWSETGLEYLQDQSNFLVVGILGSQGVGKSTLISMIGGNDPFDMYRQYIFRPASKECTETNSRQTAGVQFFVNEHRVLLLDSQAILSTAVMEQMGPSDRRYNYDSRMLENCMEIESLQIAAFMMQVCHVVVFVVDWFVDVDQLRFLQTAEMLKPSMPLSENPQGIDHFPHVVFVQNRARREDFTLLSIKSKAKFLNKSFDKSALLTKDGVSLRNSSNNFYENLGEDCGATNFFLLPDMKPRGYKAESLTSYKGIPDFETLVRDLRNQILSLSRPSFGANVQTEKQWFHLAARTWDMTRKSLLISEYGRMLP